VVERRWSRGRQPIFAPAIFQERFQTIERVFAWEDKFRRLLLRFERLSELHYALKSLAYTLDQSSAFRRELKPSSSVPFKVSALKTQNCGALKTEILGKGAGKLPKILPPNSLIVQLHLTFENFASNLYKTRNQ
jgi:hypothetical protein